MYELLIANKETGEIWNVANSVSNVDITTERIGQPGQCSFTIHGTSINFSEGDIVRFSENGESQFYGYVFTRSLNREGDMDVTCYDRIRYLKANMTYAFYNQTAGDIIRQIAEDLQIDVGEVANTGYRIPSLIKQDQPCIDIIQEAINMTLLNTGIIYVLYDNGSGLSLKSSADWFSGYLVGDKSLLTDYTYKTDIDSQTYNRVKLVQPNQKTGKNDVVMVQDSENIGRWGLLQLTQSVNGDYNAAQMAEQAKQTLKFYNRVLKTINMKSIGINGLRAGMLLRVQIKDIDISQFVLLERVTHYWREGEHTMEMETLEL